MRPELFIYGVPGKVGGAATKIRHLLWLLHDDFAITVAVDQRHWLRDKELTTLLRRLGVSACLWKDVPPRPGAVALVICEPSFFTSGQAEVVKRKGLRLVFSNEMMWEFPGEADAVRRGLIDKVLFVSDFQAAHFAALYKGVPSALTGNYVAPEEFPYVERSHPVFTIGRLSRPDPDKYPEDFPVFYEELGLRDARYRVMAWDENLRRKYRWHRFGAQWDLLPANKESSARFLHSLDLFVYPLGHRVKESWGRSCVEAMLTGCIPIVPDGHQFHNFVNHGETGFICTTFEEFRDCVHQMFDDYPRRRAMGRRCADQARTTLCNRETHRQTWVQALMS